MSNLEKSQEDVKNYVEEHLSGFERLHYYQFEFNYDQSNSTRPVVSEKKEYVAKNVKQAWMIAIEEATRCHPPIKTVTIISGT